MGEGTLTIYSASAGSGKTYVLTEIFLSSLFRSRHSYRRILAVTFTHKATAEMKTRILDNLSRLAKGENCDHLDALVKSTGKDEAAIRREAKEILGSVLHDYSRFSVSTIDSFFQKILRAFTREAGLHTGFSIELEHDLILADAVDEMLRSSKDDTMLRDWLRTYALANISEEKSWNLRTEIINLSEELFREKFKILSADQQSRLADKNFLIAYIGKLKSVLSQFEARLKEYGSQLSGQILHHGVTDDMFFQKGRGVPGFVRTLSAGKAKEPNSWVREAVNEPPKWSSGKMAPQLIAAVGSGLGESLSSAISYYDREIVSYKSAGVILANIYALGILSDVLNHVHAITSSGNTFLLSDAGEVLSLITGADQAPFIYEKTGNRYETYMIDEFQDTSVIQWKNFSPLIWNSMAEGNDNLVVGDVKQSIYRWRNSDWQILGRELAGIVDSKRFIGRNLAINWRSRSNIIRFNNSLFTVIPGIIDSRLDKDDDQRSFSDLYSEAVQTDPGKLDGGYVRLEFIEQEDDNDWEALVLARIPEYIRTVQDAGYRPSDIGIIVRDSREGAMVLSALVDYRNSLDSEIQGRYNFNVVSDDSLLLSSNPAINFIIAVFSAVNDPGDNISRALMIRTYLSSSGDRRADTISLLAGSLDETSDLVFPAGWKDLLDGLNNLPIFEASERIISFFRLGEDIYNSAYLNTFQDHLLEFAGNKYAGLQSFLDWWDSSGRKKSVVLPGGQEAMRILTIHKSKGLEFRIVILPFISWNLDHKPSRHPFLWVRPQVYPFNELGIVPVKYGQDLTSTIFSKDYSDERYSVYLDNINLLYVAFTRAKDAIIGFSVISNKSEKNIPGLLKEALSYKSNEHLQGRMDLSQYFSGNAVFEYGELPDNKAEYKAGTGRKSPGYKVSVLPGSLRLKLHGENYFSSESAEVRKKINYGKLMHEVFAGIRTKEDVQAVLRNMVLEGKLPAEDYDPVERRIMSYLDEPEVADWFSKDNEVLTETGIIIPNAGTKRPDRVIFRNGNAVIIDFKFGSENPRYISQVNEYRRLLLAMGYKNVEARLWYVDRNKIVSV